MKKPKSVKPIRISPPSTKQRIIFWVGIGLAVAIIIVGWVNTYRQVLRLEVANIRTQIDTSIEKAADTFTDFSSSTTGPAEEEIQQFKDNLEIFYQAVDEEKARQEAEMESEPDQDTLTE